MTERMTVTVDGAELSVLRHGAGTPALLLLHGTFWSRVWAPILPDLGASLPAAAIDFPGFGLSGGELSVEQARVPELAQLVLRVADALGAPRFTVAGHDIGGAVAQHLAARHPERAQALVLADSVLYDSWPVPAVARYGDPATRASTTPEEFRAQRRTSLEGALGDQLTGELAADYLSPWESEPRIRSWMALAAAADARYTQELVPALRDGGVPTLLIWGEDDPFQSVEYAERFAAEIPSATLVRIPRARHIPMEDDPERVAGELATFLEAISLDEAG
jgi:pimeloyl-ACP methyl ester carboxylesterase